MFRILVYKLPEDGRVMHTQVKVNETVFVRCAYVGFINYIYGKDTKMMSSEYNVQSSGIKLK
jgi:hypothetical protein